MAVNTAVGNDRQSSLPVFNYHLGRIKDNPVGVVGDVAKVRVSNYGRRANSRLRTIYYSRQRVPPPSAPPLKGGTRTETEKYR